MVDRCRQGMVLASGVHQNDPYGSWDLLAAIGAASHFTIPFNQFKNNPFEGMQQFIDNQDGWCFFHLSYDLKNAIEKLSSSNPDRIQFPELNVFTPMALVGIRKGKLYTQGDPAILKELRSRAGQQQCNTTLPDMQVQAVIKQHQYLEAIHAVKEHIRLGNIYELNFCQEFFGELPATFSPATLWERLYHSANAPFSAFYRWGEHLLCSASPERFICSHDQKIIAQPMKGTTRRGATPEEDRMLREQLQNNTKERAENVMIVDLVRNDLSRFAVRGSVKAEELFGVYPFATVNQMISTISAIPQPNTSIETILNSTFPMGSMTGAPKISAMQLIEQFESSRRGLFSGSVGYIDPNKQFDMNVIIRSVICHLGQRVCSIQTGGAITDASSPSEEYEESMLKARNLFKALNATLHV